MKGAMEWDKLVIFIILIIVLVFAFFILRDIDSIRQLIEKAFKI